MYINMQLTVSSTSRAISFSLANFQISFGSCTTLSPTPRTSISEVK